MVIHTLDKTHKTIIGVRNYWSCNAGRPTAKFRLGACGTQRAVATAQYD